MTFVTVCEAALHAEQRALIRVNIFFFTPIILFVFRSNQALEARLIFSGRIPRARRLHIVLWVYVRSNLSNSAARLSTTRCLQRGGTPLSLAPPHLALKFWNLISDGRVKGWRPRPDPPGRGVCVKSFTPWAVVEGGQGVRQQRGAGGQAGGGRQRGGPARPGPLRRHASPPAHLSSPAQGTNKQSPRGFPSR